MGSVATFLDIDQATVERRATADVGQPIGCERVDIAVIGREFVPAHRGRKHHALPHHAVDAGYQCTTAALVEDAYAIAILDSAGTCILIVEKQGGRLPFGRMLVAEGGIHAVVA